VRLYTCNRAVMHTLRAMVSRSAMVMAELRRLHSFLEGKEIVETFGKTSLQTWVAKNRYGLTVRRTTVQDGIEMGPRSG
jgi:hypothetical protein